MGGKSSSSSSSSNKTEQIDRRIGATDGSVVVAEGSTLNTSDFGAIEAAKEQGLAALSSGETIALAAIENANGLSIGALGSIGSNADKAFEFVDKQRQDEDQRTARTITPWLMAGVAAIAIAPAFIKGMK